MVFDFLRSSFAILALKTVNTEELDVDTNKERDTKRDHAIPGQIMRDTADTRIAGGRQVIRMVTTKQKTNPYNVVGSRNKLENNIEPEELTMGQKLAMKHYLRDPEKKKENTVILQCIIYCRKLDLMKDDRTFH